MQRISYFLFRIVVAFVSLLPFPLLYLFSDFACFLLHRVFKYRVKVVQSNLQKVYPNKSEVERSKIEKDFYQSLTDIILETIKSNGTSDAKIIPRAKDDNVNELQAFIDRGRSVIMLAAHQGNWEWYSVNLSNNKLPTSVIFKELANPYINDYLDKKRSRAHIQMMPMQFTAETFAKSHEEIRTYVLVADQNPSNASKGYWFDFFGIDTVFLHGPEKYSRKYNLPTFFGQLKRVRRGYYNATFELLAENPAELEEGELTRRYVKKLEACIREQPETWLWSHKRWKHSR